MLEFPRAHQQAITSGKVCNIWWKRSISTLNHAHLAALQGPRGRRLHEEVGVHRGTSRGDPIADGLGGWNDAWKERIHFVRIWLWHQGQNMQMRSCKRHYNVEGGKVQLQAGSPACARSFAANAAAVGGEVGWRVEASSRPTAVAPVAVGESPTEMNGMPAAKGKGSSEALASPPPRRSLTLEEAEGSLRSSSATAAWTMMLPLLETRKGQGRSCTDPANGELPLILEVGVSGTGAPGGAERLLSGRESPLASETSEDPEIERVLLAESLEAANAAEVAEGGCSPPARTEDAEAFDGRRGAVGGRPLEETTEPYEEESTECPLPWRRCLGMEDKRAWG